MSKNNDKELLNKIHFSETSHSLSFRVGGADFHLRGEGASIDYASKTKLSFFIRLKNCKFGSSDVDLNADIEIFPFDDCIKTYSEKEFSKGQDYLLKEDLGWERLPLQYWGNGCIVYTKASLSLYCTEKEFQFIQNMLMYSETNNRILKKADQELSITVIITHPNFLDESGEMKDEFYKQGVWYDHEVFCIDGWTMEYSS